MRKAIKWWLLVVVTVLVMSPGMVYANNSAKSNLSNFGPEIRVGLWSGQANIVLTSNTAVTIVDSETRKVVKDVPSLQRVAVTHNKQVLLVNGEPIKARAISVVLKSPAAEHYIEVNKRQYRGIIDIWYVPAHEGLVVVNTLPVEQYLYGMISGEISPAWPLEAVKAQAVAARTYALANIGKHKADGYDVCATTHCQVYLGRESETARVLTAVDATRGLVVTYNNQLIPTYFFSSSGGYTENSENVWGSYIPYLRATPDFDQDSPYSKWEKTFKPAELDLLIAKAGYHIGPLQAIKLSPLSPAPVEAVDRGISGRVKTLQLIGTKGSVEISGTKLRSILGLNSTLFDVQVVLSRQKTVEFGITDSYGDREHKKIEINLPDRGEQRLMTDKVNVRRLNGRPGEIVVFTGSGLGHGVGLSQWGAKAMAEKAPAGDTTYFQQILKHYYRNSEITNLY